MYINIYILYIHIYILYVNRFVYTRYFSKSYERGVRWLPLSFLQQCVLEFSTSTIYEKCDDESWKTCTQIKCVEKFEFVGNCTSTNIIPIIVL